MTRDNHDAAPQPNRDSARREPQREENRGSARIESKEDDSNLRQHWINRNLRSLYEEVASEPIPDSFKSLLDALEEKEEKSSDAPAEESESDERRTPRTHS